MRSFDLGAAKRGEPFVTRDGRKAKFIAHVPEASKYYRVIVFLGNYQECLTYAENGRYLGSGESKNDLFMADTKNEREFPEPLREAPEIGTVIYIPEVYAGGDTPVDGPYIWRNDETDRRWLRRGMIHLSRDAAADHGRAFIRASGGVV